ncbi:MAG: GC-type dockerin domain-anchored protein [Planctomycetota bacterium]
MIRPRSVVHPVWCAAALGVVAAMGCSSSSRSGSSVGEPSAAIRGDRAASALEALARKEKKFEARGGAKRADQPQEANDFFMMQRLAPGMDGYPIQHVESVAEQLRTREAAAARRGVQPGGIVGWEPIGPGNIGGRTRGLAIDPVTPETLYAGGVAGGVWKSTDAGGSWVPTGDTLINLAVASLAIDPNDPDVLYAGTGEGVFNGDSVRGLGIFKTTDGGESWNQLSSTASSSFFYVNQVKISPTDSNRIFAATRSGVWRSEDAGETFDLVLANPFEIASSPSSNGSFGGALDLDIQPGSDPEVILACFGTFQADGVFRSADGGDTWTQVGTSSDVAAVNQGRMNVEFSPSNPDVAYIATADNGDTGNSFGSFAGLFRSSDGGVTWTSQANLGSGLNFWLFSNVPFGTGCFDSVNFAQGWYDNALIVDPVDPDIVWVGGVDLFRSDDAGQTFGLASYWYFDPSDPNYVHADHHALAFHPDYNGTSNQILYSGSDGGVARTENSRASTSQNDCPLFSGDPLPGITWTQLNNGYAVTQFYHGDTSQSRPIAIGGTQDNGTTRGNSYDDQQPWDRIFGGDGGYVAIDPTNDLIVYAETQNFPNIIKSVDGGNSFFDVSFDISDTDGLFITPFIMDQNDPETLFTGGTRPWRTTDGANTWDAVGPNFDGPNRISAIGIARSNGNTVYLGFSDGWAVRSDNARSSNPTWTTVSDGLPTEAGFISWIEVDPNDPETAYASSTTFGISQVYKTTNGGGTWDAIDGIGFTGVPDIPVHCIAINPDDTDVLYAGTELGVFASSDGGDTWLPASGGLANTVVESLDFVGSDALVAFTHGRSAYRTVIDLAGDPCLADVNDDGIVTSADFFAWVVAFGDQAPECDQNLDGSCTSADFFAWVSNFGTGCD